MSMDLPPKIWLPPKPAIIRPAPVQKANFLPGMFPFIPAQSAAAVLTTLSHVNQATSTGATIDVTGLVQAGDLMVLSDLARGSGGIAPTAVLPSDFTSLHNTVQTSLIGDHRWIVSAKISSGSETVLTGMDGDAADKKIIDIYRGDVPISGFADSDFAESWGDNGNPASMTINGSGTTPVVLLLAFYNCFGGGPTIDPRTFSPAKDGETSLSSIFYSAWKIYNVGDTPANHTVDMDDEGFDNWVKKGILELS